MTFFDIARNRYSCRKYKPDPVEDEKLNYILECGRVAPSACNYQPWKIFVVREKSKLEAIHQVYRRDWFWRAPVVIIICGDHQQSWKRADGKDHCDVDIAIIADHMTLAATEQNLATCWICNFDRGKCTEVLHLPDHLEPIVILSLGYPADKADPERHSRLRKDPGEIIKRD